MIETRENRKLYFNLPLQGNLAEETWPKYLRDFSIINLMIKAIQWNDFACRHDNVIRKDGLTRFLIGESWRSRMLAIHKDDPHGVVYILEDDNKIDFEKVGALVELPPAKAVKAVTVGELVKGGYPGIAKMLELDKYRNQRLSFGHRNS